jgi:hypothetical protein
MSNFMKIRQEGAELFHTERQTRRTKESQFAILRTGLNTEQKEGHLLVLM